MSSPQLNLSVAISGVVNANAPPEPGASVSESVNISQMLQLLGGAGAGQADTVYQAVRSIAASATDVLDLSGSLFDIFGASIVLLHVKSIVVFASSANAGDIQIGPGATNAFAGPWSGTAPLQAIAAGEMAVWTKGFGAALGWVVTPGTGDLLRVVNAAAAAVSYTIVIVGTST